jgi:hypothetical protein
MKLIFSRKGFDASVGKVASPILPSGELCSLPIPESRSYDGAPRYADLRFDEHSLGKLVGDLAHGKVVPDLFAHLDPDLCRERLPRLPGWRPLLGQAGAAERHLQNSRVQPGDLFLFYGWFRRVELRYGTFCYMPGALDLHVLFGWLQIEQRIPVALRECIPTWATYHPHCRRSHVGLTSLDSLYVATEHLSLPGLSINLPGAGVFHRFHSALCLTNIDPYISRRLWRLPAWMYPASEKTPLTYHPNNTIWQRGEDGSTLLKTAGRGQEFVLDCDEYPQAVEWAAQILSQEAR